MRLKQERWHDVLQCTGSTADRDRYVDIIMSEECQQAIAAAVPRRKAK